MMVSSTSIRAIVMFLFCSSILAFTKDDITFDYNSIRSNLPRLDNVTDDMTVDDAIQLNRQWSADDENNLFSPTCVYESVYTPYGWCRHTGLQESAKYKLAIIGNSWTANHATMFYQECGYKAKRILQGAAYGCEPLYPSDNADLCLANFTDFEFRIRKEKPDYAFILTRYFSIGDPLPQNATSFDKDPVYQTMKEQMLKFISNIKHKLFILGQIPRIDARMILKVAKMIKNGVDPVAIDKTLVIPHNYEIARKRHAQLIKDCKGKCVLVDYVPEFYINATNTFRYFDERGFSYWTTPLHLSPHGIEHIRHVWTDICNNL